MISRDSLSRLRRWIRTSRRLFPRKLPTSDFSPAQIDDDLLGMLSDAELARINEMLPWSCFTTDRYGRRLGNMAWRGKRMQPQPIPDPRVELLNERFSLGDKHVLEVGCFEGVHTIGLCQYSRTVTAVDVRIENVIKTIVRTALYNCRARVSCVDVEEPYREGMLRADCVFHVGVLYHLKDPIRHLEALARWTKRGLLLDTHYALEHEANRWYPAGGRMVRYKLYKESGRADPFSGAYDHAKWLPLSDLVCVLRQVGFGIVDVVEKRSERNGPRVLLLAHKAATGDV